MIDSDRVDKVMESLRSRAEATLGEVDRAALDELGRALHELDVHQAELRLQNQSLQETQLALARSRDRYESMFRHSPVPLALTDEEGVLIDANERLGELLATPRPYLAGKPLVVYLPADGAAAFHAHRRAALASRETEHVELELRTMHGEHREAIIETSAFPDPDAPGKARLLSAFVDVTEQRAAERAKQALEARVREAERLESIGRISAGIAHDVNNLLCVVLSTADVAMETAQDTTLREDLAAIIDTCGRGARLMRGLLGIARPPAPGNQQIDVGELLARVATLERRPGIEVEVVCPFSDRVLAQGDEDQLVQVLVNLCSNSIDAMEGTGKLVLACGRTGETREVWISVTDRGCGMTPEVRARIFEPLFTTKRRSGGSGLGLSIVHNIVRANGGRIEVDSEVGAGTTMRVILPAALRLGSPTTPPGEVASELARRFLLVEDDDAVRLASTRLLTSAKAHVDAFARGDLALAAVREGLAFEIALLDIDMPVMTGPELAEALIGLRADLPVVFITGAEGATVPAAIKQRPQTRLLRKPWTKAELARTLAEIAPRA